MKHITLITTAFLTLGIAINTQAQTYYKNKAYQWKGNEIIQGKEKARALSPTEITSNYVRKMSEGFIGWDEDPINRRHWSLTRDISALPVYTSKSLLEQANYNLSLQESLEAIEPDSTFRTGIFWGGVWTRDVSYSILHSLAQLHPEVSKTSLLAKINANNRIIQDTGTGGAWPCSTDRTTWVLAAWEVYKVTGEKEWLDRIFPVVRNTIEDDRIVAYDPATQLMRGETSFLDWREQEYPVWAQPNDIYQSEALGTTLVHYQSLRILAEMCRLEGQPRDAEKYESWAEGLAEGINRHLWLEDKGYYGIYLYGRRHLMLHPQSETLGEAFAILFGLANEARARRITESVVNEPYGTPCMYPNLADQPPYHNDATWPFVQGYWMKANAQAGNEEGVLHSIASIYRAATLWLTNQENYVVYNGDYGGTQLNSGRQLWSVAANLAIVPSIYFGIRYEVDGIRFAPFVPKALADTRTLKNFRYRNAVLDMTVKGFGNRIKAFRLDGKELDAAKEAFFPGDLPGKHVIEMELCNEQPTKLSVTYADNVYQPNTPVVQLQENRLTWEPVEDASEYSILRNGQPIATVKETAYTLQDFGEFQVQAIGTNGHPSFACEPLNYDRSENTLLYEVENYALPFDANRKVVKESMGVGEGAVSTTQECQPTPSLAGIRFNGASGHFAQITRNENILITIPVEILQAGIYAIDWRYANGNGPINTENKCALRLLKVDGESVGACVFAQRGTDEWDNWGWSNVQCTELTAGRHTVTLEFAECVENMNLVTNMALLDQLRLTQIDDKKE